MGGAVAGGHELTVSAASEVVRAGGNAFDAAIAGVWMACVVEPVMASIGGGGFLMARSNEGESRLFDFFVQTPSRRPPLSAVDFEAIHADFGAATQEFHIGAGACAVPGLVSGLFAVHAMFGRMPMAELTAPAVEAAKSGWRMDDFQAKLLRVIMPICLRNKRGRELFAPAGHLPTPGDHLTNPELADVIDVIGREGEGIARHGEVARAMLEGLVGGALDLSDFANYDVEQRVPVVEDIAGVKIILNPPPSFGGALIARMLAESMATNNREPRLPPMVRAKIMASTDRAWRHAEGNLSRFDPAITRNRGTTHLSVIDKEGNAAAVTLSNGEGNGIVVPGCGFMLNNMLGEEDLNPAGFYRWPEDTRLASAMAPTILVGPGDRVTAMGSGGANRIRTAIYQVALPLIRQPGGGLDDIVASPRMHVEHGHLDFEDMLPPTDREALTAAFPDHRAWPGSSMFFGGVHVAQRLGPNGYAAAGDPRRHGAANHW